MLSWHYLRALFATSPVHSLNVDGLSSRLTSAITNMLGTCAYPSPHPSKVQSDYDQVSIVCICLIHGHSKGVSDAIRTYKRMIFHSCMFDDGSFFIVSKRWRAAIKCSQTQQFPTDYRGWDFLLLVLCVMFCDGIFPTSPSKVRAVLTGTVLICFFALTIRCGPSIHGHM